jgi:4-hydroxy-3-polyprenylbenzoate decarboxylase
MGHVRFVVGLTGASGAIYGYTLIRTLAAMGADLHLILTRMGEQVLAFECGVKKRELLDYGRIWPNDDMFAPVASGTFLTDGMVIMPCSMNSLGAIANGVGDTLLYRAASVHLKERRRLIVVPRETPLHLIHLQNMERLTLAGALVMPASPGFYERPRELWELANFMVARVLDAFGVEHDLFPRWGSHHAPPTE